MASAAIALQQEKPRGGVRLLIDRTAGGLLVKLKFTPNQVTLSGLAIFLAGIVLFPRYIWLGLGVATAGAMLDVCDGSVAYLRGMASDFGEALDSVCDRVAETAMFAALIYVYSHHNWGYTMVVVATGGSITVSYARSKAEKLGFEVKGLVAHLGARHIRMPLLAAMVIAGHWIGYQYAGYAIAALSWPFVVHRLLWLYHQLNPPLDPTFIGHDGDQP